MKTFRQMLGFFLLVITMFTPTHSLSAEHDDGHHGHESGSVEVGLSNSLVYVPGEQNFAYGLHVHGLYTFVETPFSLGLGYEAIVGEHLHHTTGVMVCYRPTDPLNICISPGAIFNDGTVAFSVHVETTYEFELHGMHVGPTLGYAYNAQAMHISFGLHTGIEF